MMKRAKNRECFSNLFLSKLLNIFGIKRQLKTSKKDKMNLAAVIQPFSIYLHFSTFYSLIALFRTWKTGVNKSVVSSTLSCVLSLIIWHVARIQGHKLHSLVKEIGSDFESKVILRRYPMIMTITAFSICFLFPIILALDFVFNAGFNSSAYVDFWFVGNTPKVDEWLQKFLLFMCVFVYMSQQILFPAVLLIFFSVLNLKHAQKIERLKFAVKTDKFCGMALSKQFYIHRSFLMVIKKQEEIFTLSDFFDFVPFNIDCFYRTGFTNGKNYFIMSLFCYT